MSPPFTISESPSTFSPFLMVTLTPASTITLLRKSATVVFFGRSLTFVPETVYTLDLSTSAATASLSAAPISGTAVIACPKKS